jgi:hypothetical protein
MPAPKRHSLSTSDAFCQLVTQIVTSLSAKLARFLPTPLSRQDRYGKQPEFAAQACQVLLTKPLAKRDGVESEANTCEASINCLDSDEGAASLRA